MLPECANVDRFLSPATSVSGQLAAYQLMTSLLAPHSPVRLFETMQHVNPLLAPYMQLAAQADSSPNPILADVRVAMLKGTIEAQRMAVLSAPPHAGVVDKMTEGSASRSVLQSLMDLTSDQLMIDLRDQLMRCWSAAEQRPVEVFEHVFRSKSWTCVHVLSGHLSGIKDAGDVCSI